MTATTLTLRDRLRSRNVERWHYIATNIKQNIAEHSHCLSIIAEELLVSLRGDNVTIEERYAVLKYAQVHDLPEVITGDMSSLFKRLLKTKLPGFDDFMEQLEKTIVPELKELDKTFKKYPHLKIVCKAADYLEAYSYYLVAKGGDEQYNKVIFDNLDRLFSEYIEKGYEISPVLPWKEITRTKNEILSGDSLVIDFETQLADFKLNTTCKVE